MPNPESTKDVRRRLDPAFLALPLHRLADAALSRARRHGAGHADVRITRTRRGGWLARDGDLVATVDGTATGCGVRVEHRGCRGFAATTDLRPAAVAAAVDQAVAMARLAAGINGTAGAAPVRLSEEPVHREAVWCAPCEIDPFAVPDAEKAEFLTAASRGLLGHAAVRHVEARLRVVRETRFYADSRDTTTTQQRVRLHPVFTVTGTDAATGRARTVRTRGPATGRGWEYALGAGWDWVDELAQLPEELAEKTRAPVVRPGRYDLVLDPSNLALTIHETIGHATELDRVLGYEAAYAGTSFATLDRLGRLRYGVPGMHVSADRTTPHGLATIGYDDEGVETQSWPLVEDGVLAGYQTDRETAAQAGFPRSTGCSYAEDARHVQLPRMANVSLHPDPAGPSLAELIAGVEHGIHVVGDGSWSIDPRRHGFQFTGQLFHRIEHGRLVGQLNDVAYRGDTVRFWNSLARLGGPATYLLCGAFNCGKGQPVQAAPVSHGSPAAVFRDIHVTATAG
ncbi:TldD/PmbA family protein [Amycolatopsis sp. FBCC-B4732]|uniref:TldD/PmbA family protein n=1 Tax=Amycolatopsis sp. FBCC-B4732 TaxID=3079339 RepID=UPI001FF154DD|nr:TldD/PmbA family protein [Amycolatopsis sp. FBCC-B4732]UOX90700.1 TldD/PmbA family protein [Amycolatopsis sp. FBCC-B4732]